MNPNLVVGIVSTVLGLVYTLMTLRIPKASIGSPWAPVLFPLGLGVLMTVLGVYLTMMSLLKDKRIFTQQRKPLNKDFIELMVGTIVGMLAYAFLFDRIGFIASTLLFMGGIMFMVNGRKAWIKNLSVAAIFTLTVWYVFTGVLKVNLP